LPNPNAEPVRGVVHGEKDVTELCLLRGARLSFRFDYGEREVFGISVARDELAIKVRK
jgi:hypothetical protein